MRSLKSGRWGSTVRRFIRVMWQKRESWSEWWMWKICWQRGSPGWSRRSWMRMLFMQERWMIRNRWPIRSTNTDLLQFRSWIMKTAWWELLQLMMPCLFCRMRQQRTSVLWRVSVRMKILILELQYFSMQRTVLYGWCSWCCQQR